MSEIRDSIAFHYQKSPFYRTVHTDGVWGGLTPRGYIAMTLFAERNPIPRQLHYAVSPEGALGEETDRVQKDGIIREAAVTAMMDVKLAKALRDWLQEKIDQAEAIAKTKEQAESDALND